MNTNTETEPVVTLVGGPADWRGQPHLATSSDTGTYLISTCTPDREDWEDCAPRAVYMPREGSPELWDFQGWFPASGGDPAPEAYDRVAPEVLYPALTRIGVTATAVHHAVHTRIVDLLAALDESDPAERVAELATAIADEVDLLDRMIHRTDAETVARTIANHLWPA